MKMARKTLFVLAALGGFGVLVGAQVQLEVHRGVPYCTVTANGDNIDDVPHILEAFDSCGAGGVINFPTDQNYWIGQRLNPIADGVRINWSGQWTLSDNITYWRNNSYPIAFQNHAAGFILTGRNISIYGNSTGGINGNGDVWYTAEAGVTQPGRPMPFVLWNVSDVTVRDFFVKEPPLWSINIMNGTNIVFENIYVNATATEAPAGSNWVQNTDGFDTMDVNNVRLTNFSYTGGDDCFSIKPRSYNVVLENVTCTAGNGAAIGSLGQYLEDSSVENITVKDLKVGGTRYGVYIKAWMGYLVPQSSYESGGLPRGGGWGNITNITFDGVDVQGAENSFSISQDSGDNGSYVGTSMMEVSYIYLNNFFGNVSSTSNTETISCSTVYPCHDIYFTNMTVEGSTGRTLKGSCQFYENGTIHGLSGC
ncbi:putative extracellular exo-polygalacturonase [Xylariales sp. PMI_506]|nr:putative extracellular exo-polygalacturonase [Xylariales sp. PMI_506]